METKFGGRKPSSVPSPRAYQEVPVEIDLNGPLTDWGEAYYNDLLRRNPLKCQAIQFRSITEDDGKPSKLSASLLIKYFRQLIEYRVVSLKSYVKNWSSIKELAMPGWIQYIIEGLGFYTDQSTGATFYPIVKDFKDFELSLEQMGEISQALLNFKVDGRSFYTPGYPKTKRVERRLLQYTVIEDFVCANYTDDDGDEARAAWLLGNKVDKKNQDRYFPTKVEAVSTCKFDVLATETYLE